MDILNSSVLVLNKSYMPINIINVKRAFSMLFQNIANVVSVENNNYINYDFNSWAELSKLKTELEETTGLEDWIKTPKLIIETPRIIIVNDYNKIPNRKVRFNRRNVFVRDNQTCQYCGIKFDSKDLNIDHVVPKSKGGETTWKNVVCSCFKCNAKKRDRIPKEAGMKLLRKPVKPHLSPVMQSKIKNIKYNSWKNFISDVYWNTELVR